MVPRSLAILFLLMIAANTAAAGQFGHHNEPHPRPETARHHDGRNHREPIDASVTAASGLPTVIPGIGTYAGAISGVNIRGVGNYFFVDRGPRVVLAPVLAPKARIIVVDGNDNACSYEAGVCVIRP